MNKGFERRQIIRAVVPSFLRLANNNGPLNDDAVAELWQRQRQRPTKKEVMMANNTRRRKFYQVLSAQFRVDSSPSLSSGGDGGGYLAHSLLL